MSGQTKKTGRPRKGTAVRIRKSITLDPSVIDAAKDLRDLLGNESLAEICNQAILRWHSELSAVQIAFIASIRIARASLSTTVGPKVDNS